MTASCSLAQLGRDEAEDADAPRPSPSELAGARRAARRPRARAAGPGRGTAGRRLGDRGRELGAVADARHRPLHDRVARAVRLRQRGALGQRIVVLERLRRRRRSPRRRPARMPADGAEPPREVGRERGVLPERRGPPRLRRPVDVRADGRAPGLAGSRPPASSRSAARSRSRPCAGRAGVGAERAPSSAPRTAVSLPSIAATRGAQLVGQRATRAPAAAGRRARRPPRRRRRRRRPCAARCRRGRRRASAARPSSRWSRTNEPSSPTQPPASWPLAITASAPAASAASASSSRLGHHVGPEPGARGRPDRAPQRVGGERPPSRIASSASWRSSRARPQQLPRRRSGRRSARARARTAAAAGRAPASRSSANSRSNDAERAGAAGGDRHRRVGRAGRGQHDEVEQAAPPIQFVRVRKSSRLQGLWPTAGQVKSARRNVAQRGRSD